MSMQNEAFFNNESYAPLFSTKPQLMANLQTLSTINPQGDSLNSLSQNSIASKVISTPFGTIHNFLCSLNLHLSDPSQFVPSEINSLFLALTRLIDVPRPSTKKLLFISLEKLIKYMQTREVTLSIVSHCLKILTDASVKQRAFHSLIIRLLVSSAPPEIAAQLEPYVFALLDSKSLSNTICSAAFFGERIFAHPRSRQRNRLTVNRTMSSIKSMFQTIPGDSNRGDGQCSDSRLSAENFLEIDSQGSLLSASISDKWKNRLLALLGELEQREDDSASSSVLRSLRRCFPDETPRILEVLLKTQGLGVKSAFLRTRMPLLLLEIEKLLSSVLWHSSVRIEQPLFESMGSFIASNRTLRPFIEMVVSPRVDSVLKENLFYDVLYKPNNRQLFKENLLECLNIFQTLLKLICVDKGLKEDYANCKESSSVLKVLDSLKMSSEKKDEFLRSPLVPEKIALFFLDDSFLESFIEGMAEGCMSALGSDSSENLYFSGSVLGRKLVIASEFLSVYLTLVKKFCFVLNREDKHHFPKTISILQRIAKDNLQDILLAALFSSFLKINMLFNIRNPSSKIKFNPEDPNNAGSFSSPFTDLCEILTSFFFGARENFYLMDSFYKTHDSTRIDLFESKELFAKILSAITPLLEQGEQKGFKTFSKNVQDYLKRKLYKLKQTCRDLQSDLGIEDRRQKEGLRCVAFFDFLLAHSDLRGLSYGEVVEKIRLEADRFRKRLRNNRLGISKLRETFKVMVGILNSFVYLVYSDSLFSKGSSTFSIFNQHVSYFEFVQFFTLEGERLCFFFLYKTITCLQWVRAFVGFKKAMEENSSGEGGNDCECLSWASFDAYIEKEVGIVKEQLSKTLSRRANKFSCYRGVLLASLEFNQKTSFSFSQEKILNKKAIFDTLQSIKKDFNSDKHGKGYENVEKGKKGSFRGREIEVWVNKADYNIKEEKSSQLAKVQDFLKKRIEFLECDLEEESILDSLRLSTLNVENLFNE